MTSKVYIYWNLRKRCYSAKRNGKVFAHFKKASVFNPEFRVSEAGRKRVRREGVKNVHAYIVCEPQLCFFYPDDFTIAATPETAKYNPYHNETFVDSDGNALYNAQRAELTTYNRFPVIYIEKEKV